MTRIRPKRQRLVGFEALEGRLTLSSGMTVASPHVREAIVRATQRTIPASFQGRISISGSSLTITNLTGKIGTDRFTGSGSGAIAGTVFQSGNVSLSNKHGSVQLALGTSQVVKVGKSSRQLIPMEVVAASGKYARYVNDTGMITNWNIPTNPNASGRFSGFFQA